MKHSAEISTETLAGPRLGEVKDLRAWRGSELAPDAWRVSLSADCRGEILAMVEVLRKDPLPVLMLHPELFKLAACTEMMDSLQRKLRQGIGLAVVDPLPMEAISDEEALAVYYVLGQLLGRLVAQKWDGTMIYDVRDSGKSYGYGVRASITNVEQNFHNDNAFGVSPPDFVSLLCLRSALSGGVSRFTSLFAAHNVLLKEHPTALERLYQPFYFDRQAEHAPGDKKVDRFPVFSYDGDQLLARVSEGLIKKGYSLAQETLDTGGTQALDLLKQFHSTPQNWAEFTLQRGQMQYLNNRQFLHSRTRYKDHSDPDKRRHMVRLWYRDWGSRAYHG